jgi:hypothetical protein
MKYAILLLTAVLMHGCASAPKFPDYLGASYLAVETLALTTHDLCRNEVPRGPCADDAPLKTEQKDDIRKSLDSALETLDAARILYAAGRMGEADGSLQAARSILRSVEKALVSAK